MVTCPDCGTRLASRSRLPGHYRRAHPRKSLVGGEASRRSDIPKVHPVPAEIISSKPSPVRPVPIREKVFEVTASSSGIVHAKRPLATIVAQPVPTRRLEPKPGYQMPGSSVGLVDSLVAPVQRPQLTDAVVLRSQYHALMALAIRLDAGVGTEREQAAFEAALRGYNANYDRIAAGKNSSHLPALGGASPS